MKRIAYIAGPIGLALLVVGAGWGAILPNDLSIAYWSLMALGAAIWAVSLWVRRAEVFAQGGVARVRFGASAAASAGIAVAVLLLVNFFAARYQHRFDLTRTGAFSLHPTTERVLAQVQAETEITAFFPMADDGSFRAARGLLDTFARRQPKLRVTVADPNRQPDLYTRLGRPGNRVTVISRGDKHAVIAGFDEAALAAALIEVGRDAPKTIYWVIGHDERPLSGQGGLGYRLLQSDLKKEFFDIKELSLGAGERVPQDASALVFADPRKPLPAAEAAIYHDYLRAGGRVIAFVDLDVQKGSAMTDPMAPLLERWGLRAQAAIAIDPRARTGEKDPRNVVADVFDHPATEALKGQTAVLTLARPVEWFQVMEDQQIFQRNMAALSPDLRGEGRDPFAATDAALVTADPGALVGLRAPQPLEAPLPVVAAAWRKFGARGETASGREARVVLAGDADFLSDGHCDQLANRELALDLFRWVTGEELLIRKADEKKSAKEAMQISPAQRNVVVALVVVIPLAVFLSGWVVWLLRRSK